jgi:hypothetical protein
LDTTEAIREHYEISSLLYHINQKKFEELKDNYIYNVELELLAESPPESGSPDKIKMKRAGRVKKTISKRKLSQSKKSAKSESSIHNRSDCFNTCFADAAKGLRSSHTEKHNTSTVKSTSPVNEPVGLTENPYRKGMF